MSSSTLSSSSNKSATVAVSVLPIAAIAFAAGVTTARLFWGNCNRNPKKDDTIKHDGGAGATPRGDDLSLFYGDRSSLTHITDSCRFLPSDVYGPLVRDTVVCCVDIVLVRKHPITKQRECLLVQRSSEPVKGVWWWPGGRLLKGETFFAAAIRKAQQETGLHQVRPIQVLGVWNTFFPTSNWDNEESKGTQTVNPIVLVEILEEEGTADIKLDATSENYRWISLDPAAAITANEDTYVVGALQRLQAWDSSYTYG